MKIYKCILLKNNTDDCDVTLFINKNALPYLLSGSSKILKPGESYLHRSEKAFQFKIKKKVKKIMRTIVKVTKWTKDSHISINNYDYEESDLEDHALETTICIRQLNVEKEVSLEACNGQRNLYEILKLDYTKVKKLNKTELENTLKRAFHEEIRRWHPDKAGKLGDLQMTCEVIEAYYILKDPELRADYHNKVDYSEGWLSLARWKSILWPECHTEKQTKMYIKRMFMMGLSIIAVIGGLVLTGLTACAAAPAVVGVCGALGAGLTGGGIQGGLRTINQKSIEKGCGFTDFLCSFGLGFAAGAVTGGASVGIAAGISGIGSAATQASATSFGQFIGIGASSASIGGVACSLAADAEKKLVDGIDVTWKQFVAHAIAAGIIGGVTGTAVGAVSGGFAGISSNVEGQLAPRMRRFGILLGKYVSNAATNKTSESVLGSAIGVVEERLNNEQENRPVSEHLLDQGKQFVGKLALDVVVGVLATSAVHVMNKKNDDKSKSSFISEKNDKNTDSVFPNKSTDLNNPDKSIDSTSSNRKTGSASCNSNTGPTSSNRNTGSASSNRNTSSASSIRNTGSASSNRNTGSVSSNRNTTSINPDRSNDSTSSSRNTGSTSSNRNTGSASSKRNTGSASSNRNAGIVSNRNTDSINPDRSTDYTSSNRTTGSTSSKRNTGSINPDRSTDSTSSEGNTGSTSSNSNTDSINPDRSNDSITSNRNTDSASSNRNTVFTSSNRNTGSASLKRNNRNTGSARSNRNTDSINPDRSNDPISSNRTTGSARSNRNTDSISSDKSRSTDSINSKRKTGSANSNRNTGFTSSYRNTGSTSPKRNTGSASSNRNTDSINPDRSTDSTSSNRNTGSASSNRNTDSINPDRITDSNSSKRNTASACCNRSTDSIYPDISSDSTSSYRNTGSINSSRNMNTVNSDRSTHSASSCCQSNSGPRLENETTDSKFSCLKWNESQVEAKYTPPEKLTENVIQHSNSWFDIKDVPDGSATKARFKCLTNKLWFSKMIVEFKTNGNKQQEKKIAYGHESVIEIPIDAKEVNVYFKTMRFIATWCDVKKWNRFEKKWHAETHIFRYETPPEQRVFTLGGSLYFEGVIHITDERHGDVDEM